MAKVLADCLRVRSVYVIGELAVMNSEGSKAHVLVSYKPQLYGQCRPRWKIRGSTVKTTKGWNAKQPKEFSIDLSQETKV